MFQTIRTTYKWYNITENYTLTCKKCGGNFTRTISSGYNELATPESKNKYRESLEKEARHLEKIQDFICNKCTVAMIDTKTVIIDFKDDDYEDMKETGRVVKEATVHHKANVREFEKKHKGRIVLYRRRKEDKFKEWVIHHINDGWCDDEKVYANIYKINERQPWLYCDSIDEQVELEELQFTDSFLKDRDPKNNE